MVSGTLVDTNVLLDVFTDDSRWGAWSAAQLARAFDAGPVVVNPLIYAELSVGFDRIEDLEQAIPTTIERESPPGMRHFWPGAAFSCTAVAAGRVVPRSRILHRRPCGHPRTRPTDS